MLRSKILGILQATVKVLLVLCITVGIWVFLTPYFRVDRSKDGDYFRNLDENSIDVLCLGSSHMQYAFSPGVFYTDTGYYSYILGSSCQPYDQSYYLLEEALKTQHPSLVIMDVFTFLPGSQVCYADANYYKAEEMMTEETRLKAAASIPDTVEDKDAYLFDLILNHDHWKTMAITNLEEIAAETKQAEGYHWELGYVRQEPTVYQYTPLMTYEVDYKVELSDTEKKWLDAMIDLCDQENIQLLFIKTPYTIDQADTNKLSAVWEYLDSRNATYIDFIQLADEIDWFTDMDGDTWHNNSWGAEIVTDYLAQYVLDHNLVTNHTYNETLESLSLGVQSLCAQSLLNANNVNIYRLLVDAEKYPCTILFRYQGQSVSCIGDYENNAIQQLGIDHDFIEDKKEDFYAVIQNGTVLQSSDEPFTYELENIGTVDLTKEDITINGESIGSNGQMQFCFLSDTNSWHNAVGIDVTKGHFWKNGCDSWACE